MHSKRLRELIREAKILLAPGGFDGFSASLIERAGFQAMYLSGASIAYTRFGRPDIGLVSMKEVADVLSAIRERVALPIIVDADTGFGNAINVHRCIRLFETLGASGIQLEDQHLPKRCGHLPGKSLVNQTEMVGKIHAACDARQNVNTMIIARTDAIAVEGFASAMERAEAYAAAGADMLFIEAPENLEQMQSICTRFAQHTPVMANMVEGGKTPISSAEELEKLGFAMVIFPGAMVRALGFTAIEFLQSLKQHGNTDGFRSNMLNFAELNQLLGTEDLLSMGDHYAKGEAAANLQK